MLRPRDSGDNLIDDEKNPEQRLSVTMISREELPSYSTERFFMLSEFEMNAHSIRFVSELYDCNDITPETVETCETSSAAAAATPERFPPENVDSFPPYVILYILWRPDMTTSVTNFIEDVIVKSVDRIQSHVEIVLSGEDKKRTSVVRQQSLGYESPSTTTEAEAMAREHDSVASSSTGSADSGKIRLYLVVERTIPYREFGSSDTTNKNIDNNTASTTAGSQYDQNPTNQQEKDELRRKQQRYFNVDVSLAERLARHVASHPRLRSLFQGITIGVANHKRAAPALDACMGVVTVGSKDRRQVAGRDARSSVGLISISSEDLLGLDEEGETDGAQNILQTRIHTEWNGRGNLKTFAHRAHSVWRKEHGLSPQHAEYPFKGNKRRTGRRLNRLDEELGELDSFPLDLILNLGAFLLILYYVWRGIMGDLPT